MKKVELALCAGRHEIKNNNGETVDNSFFENTNNFIMSDLRKWEEYAKNRIAELTSAYMVMADIEQAQSEGYTCNTYTCKEKTCICIYVTGLTPLLASLVKASYCFKDLQICLYHYDRDTNKYISQIL